MDTPNPFKTRCPSCGKSVEAHSSGFITLVCPHCRSVLLRAGRGVADSGRDCAPLENGGTLQIGTRGVFAAQKFTLVGRLRVNYDAGAWNEWYILFDDGVDGWLSEAGDLYALTRQTALKDVRLPKTFESVRIGVSTLQWDGKTFTVSDIRSVSYSDADAEGELPFCLHGKKAGSRVCDWRSGNRFLTLDYAKPQPTAYLGRTVALKDLKLEHSAGSAAENTGKPDKAASDATDNTGRLKGTTRSAACPACGENVRWTSGIAPFLICTHCGSRLNTADDTPALEKKAAKKQEQNPFDLKIGSEGRLNDTEYRIIGAVKYAETRFGNITGSIPCISSGTPGFWTEYLLFNPQEGFAWLVESEGSWQLSLTLQTWPYFDASGNPIGYRQSAQYGGRVEAADASKRRRARFTGVSVRAI